jgi:hypothetical protein
VSTCKASPNVRNAVVIIVIIIVSEELLGVHCGDIIAQLVLDWALKMPRSGYRFGHGIHLQGNASEFIAFVE